MAPEVLLNPCTRLEEKAATQAELDIRKIVPYTSKVDVWATGVLAYELLMGRPPFEVDNEAETVGRILQCEDIAFDARFSPEWADFVRCGPDLLHGFVSVTWCRWREARPARRAVSSNPAAVQPSLQ